MAMWLKLLPLLLLLNCEMGPRPRPYIPRSLNYDRIYIPPQEIVVTDYLQYRGRNEREVERN